MPQQVVPKEAIAFFLKKKLKGIFSYREIWHEEHQNAFVVAKAMQADVLRDLYEAVKQAIAEGQSFARFRDNLQPLLKEKGWWGRRNMRNPETGEIEDVQLGSARRLKTIFEVNKRQAAQAGSWQRLQDSDAHPYLAYVLGPSGKHRKEHEVWGGLVLPKDDDFWATHHPINGYGCKCTTIAVSNARYRRYKRDGVPVGGGKMPMKQEAPPIERYDWYNKTTKKTEQIPVGIDPGFDYNPGGERKDRLDALLREKKAKGL